MDQPEYSIRRATLDDADALAQVHETAWREVYAGLMSEQLLNAITADSRATAWRRMLAGEAGFLGTTFVAERDGQLVAYASCGEQRDDDLRAKGYAGEFTAVYVLKTDQRQGLGERDTEEHRGANLAGHLGLTDHALDRLTDDDTHADAGADGCETVADSAETLEGGLFLREDLDCLKRNAHVVFRSLSVAHRRSANGAGLTM